MSSLPVIAIRPEPGLGATMQAGIQAGLHMKGYPLFEVEPVDWDQPDPAKFDALLVGSANVFRHGGDKIAALRSLPVLAVGETTAEAARDVGFTVQSVGKGGLQSLVDAYGCEEAHWLRLAGAEHVTLELPDNLQLTTCVTYRVETSEIRNEMMRLLREDCIVLLHSAAAARHFMEQCDMHGLNRSHIALAALGPRILKDLSGGWKDVQAAASPNEDALLALAKRMCETI